MDSAEWLQQLRTDVKTSSAAELVFSDAAILAQILQLVCSSISLEAPPELDLLLDEAQTPASPLSQDDCATLRLVWLLLRDACSSAPANQAAIAKEAPELPCLALQMVQQEGRTASSAHK